MARSRSPIAIDFGERAVRALQLEQHGESQRVRAAAMEPIDAGATADDRRERMIEAGRRLLRGRPFRGRSAVVALRLTDVATRHIRIPVEKLEHAGEVIARQVQDQATDGAELAICPIPVAELFDQGERKREFLCCIAKASAIQAILETTEAIGLVPEAIDLEPCALARPFVQRAAGESFLHLDIGDDDARITVVRAGVPILMRVVRIGRTKLEQLLVERLQMEVCAIHDLGRDPGTDHDELHGAVTGALAEPLETLLMRVADGVRYCGALFQGRAVNLMRVSGPVAALPGLVPYLGRRIGITAELADPFFGIEPPARARDGGGSMAGFDLALGLALRGGEA